MLSNFVFYFSFVCWEKSGRTSHCIVKVWDKHIFLKGLLQSWARWHMPVILATEAEAEVS